MSCARFLFVTALALTSCASSAQFVKGNDAVRVLPNGNRRVETPPPTATAARTSVCGANAGCYAGSWLMVETSAGLQECTEAYARPGTCRASSYGTVKRSRLWVVKAGGDWLQCQYPDLHSKCVRLFARAPANLPFDAVQ